MELLAQLTARLNGFKYSALCAVADRSAGFCCPLGVLSTDRYSAKYAVTLRCYPSLTTVKKIFMALFWILSRLSSFL